MSFIKLEHQLLKFYRQQNLRRPLLLAVSGGLDSMVLLHSHYRIQQALKLKLAIAHVHHGPGTALTSRFRRRASHHVWQAAKSLQLPYFSNAEWNEAGTHFRHLDKPAQRLCSEDELRDYRYQQLQNFAHQWDSQAMIVLAHHRQDQAETMLMNLIRGAGPEGLGGMKMMVNNRLRPLLEVDRKELEVYARQRQLEWVEDPSNQSLEPFRNWMRHEWLPALESYRPGSVSRLAASLATLYTALSASDVSGVIVENRFNLAEFSVLSEPKQKQVLALYLRQMKIRSFTRAHLEELLRRLDNRKKSFSFKLLKHIWTVDQEWLMAKATTSNTRQAKTEQTKTRQSKIRRTKALK